MLAALLLAAAAPGPMSAIDAERAFVADAQKLGQWTAFRKYAAPDALMFVPQPTNAHAFLKGRKDPPASVFWWPGRSYVSCDGTVAVNTGPWVRGYGKTVGYFTTVWVKQTDGSWKWVYDAGNEEKFMRDEGGDIKPVIASCSAVPPPPITQVPPNITKEPFQSKGGGSADRSLGWKWIVDAAGARQFLVLLWDGKKWQHVIDDRVDAPKP